MNNYEVPEVFEILFLFDIFRELLVYNLLNKNNNHAPEVHEILFLFKMYISSVIFQNDST